LDLNGNEIGGVFVRYDFVRRGVGTKLMDFIEKYALEKKISKVILRSAEYAKDFYLKIGYNLIEEIKYKESGINYLMEKNLI